MVPWWLLPIAVCASAGITLAAYAIVVVGADSERAAMPDGERAANEDSEVAG